MDVLFRVLAILVWMGVGALVAVAAMAVVRSGKGPVLTRDDFEQAMTETLEMYQELYTRRLQETYAPFAERLGKPCWVKCGHGFQERLVRHRVVAVSHKGAVNVRPWDAGKGAFWIPASKVAEKVRWEEARDDEDV